MISKTCSHNNGWQWKMGIIKKKNSRNYGHKKGLETVEKIIMLQ